MVAKIPTLEKPILFSTSNQKQHLLGGGRESLQSK